MQENQNTALTYRELQTVWQDWMDQAPDFPPLDQWLRKRPRQSTQSSHSRQQRDSAMMQAMHYRQLADALEITFRNPDFDDWHNWDTLWSHQQQPSAIPQHFWYWIQLRCDADWQTPLQLSQRKERRRHFLQVRSQLQQQELSSLALMWYGFRPGWHIWLRDRCNRSEWTPAQHDHFIKSQPHRPPLWLRPTHSSTEEQLNQLQHSLEKQGVNAALDNGRLLARGGQDVYQTSAFKEGQLDIQDLASQLIVEAIAPKPGDKIWDACAGAGGKSLAMAARMNQKGSITATDIRANKLDELKRRAKRAGYRNIRTFEWQGEEALRLPAEIRQQGGFDKVLIDAPCSSAGTWRRNPDARWKISHRRVLLHRLQQQLLTNAASAVRAGGQLTYATCSWLVDENEMQVQAFLDAHPEFTLLKQQLLGLPEHNSDTMFVAVMTRNAI